MSLLKRYASFLKENYLNELTAVYFSYVTQLDVPLLKFFSHWSHDQLLESAKVGIDKLLTDFENDAFLETVKQSIKNWEEDKLEGVTKQQIQPSDLILIYAAQEMSMVEFIDKFTKDSSEVIQITILLKQHYSEAQKIGFEALFKIRDEAVEMLKESEERFRSFSQTAADGVIIVNEDREIIFWNKGACKIFGYTSDEIIGHTVRSLMPEQYQEKKDEIISILKSGEIEAIEPQEFIFLHKTGREIPVELSASTWTTKIGRYYSFIIHDITERKRAEQELRFSNQELEQFAYIASHDLKEPLRMVSNYLQLLEIKHGKELSEDGRTNMQFAVDGAKRMGSLINAILNYSRVNTRKEPFVEVDTNALVKEVLHNISEIIEERDAKIKFANLPKVNGDPVQLSQLFQNLIMNGIKFTEQQPQINLQAEKQKNQKWLFSVTDNGIGIDESYSERIFVMFQRLHNRKDYPGTGMGLAISKKIVEKHGGEIWFESQDGKGTTFYFTLDAVH